MNVFLPDCPICGQPANKTNTHLLPWFIIKHYVTEKGSGIRDKHLSFTIGSRGPVKLHAGRGVLPETLDGFGELHEVEIEASDPYARNNIWCAACEDKFSRLEAIFAVTFSEQRLKNLPEDMNPYHGQRVFLNADIHTSLYQLFIHSIFWRCSVGRFDGLTLEPAVERKLLANLQSAFQTPNFVKLKKTDVLPVVHEFPLVTSYLCRKDGVDTTANYISTNKVRWPYMVIGGQWIFQLFEKSGHIRGTNEFLYGLRDALDTPGLYPKIAGRSHAVLVNTAVSERFVERLIQAVSTLKTQDIRETARMLHDGIFKVPASEEVVNYLVQRFLARKEEGNAEVKSYQLAFGDFANELGILSPT